MAWMTYERLRLELSCCKERPHNGHFQGFYDFMNTIYIRTSRNKSAPPSIQSQDQTRYKTRTKTRPSTTLSLLESDTDLPELLAVQGPDRPSEVQGAQSETVT